MRKHPMPLTLSLVLTALLCTGIETAKGASPSADDLLSPGGPMASCMREAASRLAFSGTVFARNAGSAVQLSFGTADAQGHEPITAQTQFNIGSAGKMFTAVAIAVLVDRGAIALDAPIGRYLDGLTPATGSVTIEELLNHTSGLGDYLKPANRAAIEAATTATQLLPLALAAPPTFVPGSRRAYSNSGFVVLGAVIEKISGQSYADFVQKDILEPLGLAETRLDGLGAAEPMTRMSPAGPLDRAVPSPFRQQRASPAGGIVSTANDLSRFLAALLDSRLVRRATLERFLEPRQDLGGASSPSGLGFNVRNTPRSRIGHGGGAPGVNAEVALFPDLGWQIIALSNRDPPTASRLVDILEEAAFADDPSEACGIAVKAALKAKSSVPGR